MHVRESTVEIESSKRGKMAGRSMVFRRMRYRPAVFFLYLRLIVLSVLQGKIRRVSFVRFIFIIIMFMKD
jgi:hypothetical protein